ncbi:hypothetical protein [Ranid herpesvirus 3]|uniref:Uncharacterized protein n=1 Tax=Ranid herpesvirus 3 TaxID=1987509 RepID=A0A1X9T5D0_9VIRU|nr:hypothetical protein [Ranid herpesvirus 3]ARR28908.1 hypothetical protein [Ranid herpesvirus 3]
MTFSICVLTFSNFSAKVKYERVLGCRFSKTYKSFKISTWVLFNKTSSSFARIIFLRSTQAAASIARTLSYMFIKLQANVFNSWQSVIRLLLLFKASSGFVWQ